jgi:hypothetical protein
MPILKSELLQGRDQTYASDYTQTISDNLDKLLIPMNLIRNSYGIPMIVDSGWRPPAVNAACGGAPNSKHMEGLACDIADQDGEVWKWVLDNLLALQHLNIYLEDKRWTPEWVHFQLGGPASGRRIFVPNTSPAKSPDIWNGIYDSEYNGSPKQNP